MFSTSNEDEGRKNRKASLQQFFPISLTEKSESKVLATHTNCLLWKTVMVSFLYMCAITEIDEDKTDYPVLGYLTRK